MSVEPAPKVYLQNRLGKCRGKVLELDPVIESKRPSLILPPPIAMGASPAPSSAILPLDEPSLARLDGHRMETSESSVRMSVISSRRASRPPLPQQIVNPSRAQRYSVRLPLHNNSDNGNIV